MRDILQVDGVIGNRIASIDRFSRLVESLPRADDSVFEKNGLGVVGKAVVCHDCERRSQWQEKVADVASKQLSSMVLARMAPQPVIIGLESCGQAGIIHVLVRSEGVCPIAGLETACDALGITPSERRVMSYLASGVSLKRIALKTGTEMSTVRTHIKSLSKKTGSSGITSLIYFFATLPRSNTGYRPMRRVAQ